MVDEQSLAIFMGAFVVWGFLMAMLFNLMLLGFGAKKDLRLVWVSVVMFISYFISDLSHDFFRTSDVLLTWFYYDAVTLILILPVIFLRKVKVSSGVVYVVLGLSFNSALFLLMHYDLVVVGNTETWWLWYVYSVGINVSDLLMIVALIVDRDILGLITLKNFLTVKIFSKRHSDYREHSVTMSA